MKYDNIFQTSDLPLATLLSLHYPLLSINKSNPSRVVFSFTNNHKLENIVNEYWLGKTNVEPNSYATQMKVLKNRIYAN